MTKTIREPRNSHQKSYVLGRRGFAQISAVEGIRLSPEMEEMFAEFDRNGIPPSERRKLIARKYGKVR